MFDITNSAVLECHVEKATTVHGKKIHQKSSGKAKVYAILNILAQAKYLQSNSDELKERWKSNSIY